MDNSKLQYFVQQAADFSAGLPHSTLAINPGMSVCLFSRVSLSVCVGVFPSSKNYQYPIHSILRLLFHRFLKKIIDSLLISAKLKSFFDFWKLKKTVNKAIFRNHAF